ncbi:hypothetical protein WLW85_24170, partial [Bordetella bronchiseptica]
MEPIHRRRDFLQRASALLLSGTLLGGCAARRPAPGPQHHGRRPHRRHRMRHRVQRRHRQGRHV